MVKVVAAVLLVCILPSEDVLGLVLYCDALFELGIVVHAAVALLRRDQDRVEFLSRVNLGGEHIIRD